MKLKLPWQSWNCRDEIEIAVMKLKLPWWSWNCRERSWNCRGEIEIAVNEVEIAVVKLKLPWRSWNCRERSWNCRGEIEIAVMKLKLPWTKLKLPWWNWNCRERSWNCRDTFGPPYVFVYRTYHIVSWRFTILLWGWDRTLVCKEATGSHYQSIIWSRPPTQPTHEFERYVKPEIEIDHHSGNYVPYSFRTVCGFFNVPQTNYQSKASIGELVDRNRFHLVLRPYTGKARLNT